MAWGGRREGSGRKPGQINKFGDRHLKEMRRATAEQILSLQDEFKLWAGFLHGKDKWLAFSALRYLTDRRDGRTYQALNPAQVQPVAGNDPRLATLLQNVLPPPGSAQVTVTQTKMQITAGQTLENTGIEAKAKTPSHTLLEGAGTTLTHDGTVVSDYDPSGREAGGGQNARESHTQNFQDSETR